jgi:hypothetical protein
MGKIVVMQIAVFFIIVHSPWEDLNWRLFNPRADARREGISALL